MAQSKVTLRVEGEVSLSDFQTVIDAFVSLMQTLTNEADPDARVEWVVSKFEGGGSFDLASTAIAEDEAGVAAAQAAEARYDEVAEHLARGAIRDLPVYIRRDLVPLTSVLNHRIPRMKMGSTSEQQWVIDTPSAPLLEDATETQVALRNYVRTSVRGKVVTASDERGLYFTLDEAFTQRKYRCYAPPKFRKLIGEAWIDGRWLVVEGSLNHKADPPTLTLITDIVELPHSEPGDWRAARGCLQ